MQTPGIRRGHTVSFFIKDLPNSSCSTPKAVQLVFSFSYQKQIDYELIGNQLRIASKDLLPVLIVLGIDGSRWHRRSSSSTKYRYIIAHDERGKECRNITDARENIERLQKDYFDKEYPAKIHAYIPGRASNSFHITIERRLPKAELKKIVLEEMLSKDEIVRNYDGDESRLSVSAHYCDDLDDLQEIQKIEGAYLFIREHIFVPEFALPENNDGHQAYNKIHRLKDKLENGWSGQLKSVFDLIQKYDSMCDEYFNKHRATRINELPPTKKEILEKYDELVAGCKLKDEMEEKLLFTFHPELNEEKEAIETICIIINNMIKKNRDVLIRELTKVKREIIRKYLNGLASCSPATIHINQLIFDATLSADKIVEDYFAKGRPKGLTATERLPLDQFVGVGDSPATAT